MYKTYRYRAYPNKSQKSQISNTIGCCRFVFNRILSHRIEVYQTKGETLSKLDCNNYCNRVLKESHPWLRNVDKYALTNAIFAVDNAYARFFKKLSSFPCFKRKSSSRQSYTTNNNKVSIRLNNQLSKLKLPKLGWLSVVVHRPLAGIIKHVTVTWLKADIYYVSILVEEEIAKLPPSTNEIGIDMGVRFTCVTSDGSKYPNKEAKNKHLKQINKLHSRLSKKQKGSKNYIKLHKKLSKCYLKLENTRKDFLHKLSSMIVRENQTIFIEDLDISGMLTGKVAKYLVGASLQEFSKQLIYKSIWYGRTCEKIDRFYASSQICNICGFKNATLKNTAIRNWVCPSCNTKHDRDINAAINILKLGKKQ